MKPTMAKNINQSTLIAILLFSIACEPVYEIPYRHFIIAKGEHYSNKRSVELMQGAVLEFEASFDATAMYSLGSDALQSQKNKLLGFSDCNSMHHENSARFGWQWYNNQLEIYAYCYVNNQRVEQFVGVVNINETNKYKIEVSHNKYTFRLNSLDPVEIDRGNTCERGVYYMLWPYFGGGVPAPHDVNISLRIIK